MRHAGSRKSWRRWLTLRRLIPLAIIVVAGGAGILSRLGLLQAKPIESVLLAVLALLAVDALTERINLLERIEERLSNLTSVSGLRERAQIPLIHEEAVDASEIVVVGASLISWVVPHYDFFERQMKRGCKFRFLLLDPTSPAVPVWDLTTRSPVIKIDIERTLESLKLMKQAEKDSRGRCEVRLGKVFPPFSMIAVDPAKDTGWMIVEIHTYKRTLGERPHIRLSHMSDNKWFDFYVGQYEQLWEDSTIWDPSEV
jgi:hypothetical protein